METESWKQKLYEKLIMNQTDGQKHFIHYRNLKI